MDKETLELGIDRACCKNCRNKINQSKIHLCCDYCGDYFCDKCLKEHDVENCKHEKTKMQFAEIRKTHPYYTIKI